MLFDLLLYVYSFVDIESHFILFCLFLYAVHGLLSVIIVEYLITVEYVKRSSSTTSSENESLAKLNEKSFPKLTFRNKKFGNFSVFLF
jgi:hypothetical protein